ncbi:MAG TPA: signal peptide peptidase SppA [Spirochaeta sp.]|nr:signal peptide peptidase SppA [Spirochaeta sp.]
MKYTKLILSGGYRETGIQTRGLTTAARREGFRFDQFYLKTEAIIEKKNITKVLIECRQDFSSGIFSGLEEIRERIEALKLSGKEVYFYTHTYGVQELFLSAVCSYRLIHPMGNLRFFGLSYSFLFAKRVIRRFGIDAEIIRRGSYKSAGDRFRTDSLDLANREQYEHYLSSVMQVIRDGVKSGFDKSDEDIDDLLEGEVLNSDAAADAGWIDEIVTLSDFITRWDEQKDREFKFKRMPQKAGKRRLFREEQIAVLVFEGAVVEGYSKRDPLMGQAVGAESFKPVIKKLREDKKVKAVVFRINSGGGSAFASEDITAELRLLAAEKPLIVSMSEVAGSGGYWMSCCGRNTFAMPTTLTGSIGVISMHLSWRRLLDMTGLTHDTIREGEHADAGTPFRELTDEEKKMVDMEIEDMYDGFINMVAESRDKTTEEIDALARGRVWPGMTASKHNLIDSIGGLSDAVSAAVRESSLKKPTVRFYPELKHGLIERIVMNMSGNDGDMDVSATLTALKNMLSGGSLNTGPAALMEEVLFKWN